MGTPRLFEDGEVCEILLRSGVPSGVTGTVAWKQEIGLGNPDPIVNVYELTLSDFDNQIFKDIAMEDVRAGKVGTYWGRKHNFLEMYLRKVP